MVAVVVLIAVHAGTGTSVTTDPNICFCVSQWCVILAHTAEVRGECAHDIETLQAQEFALRGNTPARSITDDKKAPHAEQVTCALGVRPLDISNAYLFLVP